MIKSENYGKINEIYRKIPLKTLKKISPSFMGGPASPDRGDFSDFSITGGDFRLIPPYLSLMYMQHFNKGCRKKFAVFYDILN